jgi:hypothetical protein
MEEMYGVKTSGSGNVIEQVSRNQRLHFVMGYVMAKCGTLQFIGALYDRKGTLNVDMGMRHAPTESALREAWAAAGESMDSVEFSFRVGVNPSKCATCEARTFCRS